MTKIELEKKATDLYNEFTQFLPMPMDGKKMSAKIYVQNYYEIERQIMQSACDDDINKLFRRELADKIMKKYSIRVGAEKE